MQLVVVCQLELTGRVDVPRAVAPRTVGVEPHRIKAVVTDLARRVREQRAVIRNEALRIDRQLRPVLRRVHAGPLDPLSRYGLSNREREVLELVAAGQANREIARRRYITPSTAGVHVSHVIAKLGVANRVQAAALAARRDGPTAQVSARSVRDDQ